MMDPLTCRDVASLLTDYMERTIPWNQRIFTRMHLQICPECHRLFSDFEALPTYIERFGDSDPAELAPIAEAALTNALSRLKAPPRPRPLPASTIPDAVQRILAATPDQPLKLMALTQSAMAQGTAPQTAPYLPEAVLAQLPPSDTWKWRHFPGGIKRALLWAEEDGPTLSLITMPPKFTIAPHTHEGSESLLVLDGELEHGNRCLMRGDWVHLETGSSHSPYAFDHGCCCLVREEGNMHFANPLHWLKSLMAGA